MSGKTRFYNRQVAESLSTTHNIISIGENGDGWKLNSCHTNVIRLLFDDIQEYLEEKYTLFSGEQAQAIIKWLQSIPDDSLVIVHCEGGVARSAAVVKFMVDKLGYEFEADRYCKGDYSLMNVFVYDTLVAQYESMEKSP
jgi:predicted protein tyrosine phosphatase